MKFAFLILVIVALGVGCQKKKASKHSSIEIGNKRHAQVTEQNLIIASSGFNDVQFGQLDIDGDGLNDILLKSVITGSPGIGVWNGYEITSWNPNLEFASGLYDLENWIKYDTSYFEHPISGQIYVTFIEKKACMQLDSLYSLSSVQTDLVNTSIFPEGYKLNKSDFFSTEIYNLTTQGDYSSNPYHLYTSNDTLYHSASQVYREACTPVKNGFTGYLGLKLTTSGEEKLGWIKLSIQDGYKIQIFETAIQQ